LRRVERRLVVVLPLPEIEKAPREWSLVGVVLKRQLPMRSS
jgi:hypothetical protein